MGHSIPIQQISEKPVALKVTKFCTTLYAESLVPLQLARAFRESSENYL
jgi:hypothetical protein